MDLIFKIVAALIISYLILIIVNLKYDDYIAWSQSKESSQNISVKKEEIKLKAAKSNEISVKKEVTESELEQKKEFSEKMADNLINLSASVKSKINTYYQINKFLPKYVSDLSCEEGETCAYSQSNGYFFIKSESNWLAIRPRTTNDFIVYDCFTSLDVRLTSPDKQLQLCPNLSSSPIQEPIKPSFNCGAASNFVEKSICSSDELAELDLKLEEKYKRKTIEPGEQVDIVKKNQIDFIKKRNATCKDFACIESMTRDRISEL